MLLRRHDQPLPRGKTDGEQLVDRPVFLKFVDLGVAVRAEINQVWNIVSLLVGHRRIKARSVGLFTGNMRGFARACCRAVFPIDRELAPTAWQSAEIATAEG